MSETSDETLPTKVTAQAPPPVAPHRDPQERLSELMRQHPVLVVGGGLALGVLASALLPRGAARRLARGAVAAAAIGGEASLALARKAREGTRSAAGETTTRLRSLEDRAGDGARRLRRTTAVAAGNATSTGLDLARAGLRLLSSLRR